MARQSQSPTAGSAARTALVYFAKLPQPGLVKTRLCPPLSSEEAAALYGAFLRQGVVAHPDLDSYCYGWPADRLEELGRYLPEGLILCPQQGRDLWARMAHCFKERLSAGHPAVLLRNTDSPDLPTRIIDEAAAACAPRRVVLGPDQGGGYYLIGLSEPHPELFIDLDEGAPTVWEASIQRVAELGLELHVLPSWRDIDNFEDLCAYWQRQL